MKQKTLIIHIYRDKNMTKEEFLKSKDFMKIGQSIEHGAWQIAGMTAQRMQKNAKEIELSTFDRQLIGLKQCIASRNKTEALNILSLIVTKRVQMLNSMNDNQSKDDAARV